MFFYISFLRTPPHSSLQSSPIVFTPQVSNDLRTEPFPTSVDIFYWWISCASQNVIRLSEPAKLTTWRQENAYKPLQIPPPSKNLSGVAGMDCCLVLSPSPTVASSEIDLRDPDIGSLPLPVRSLPIRLISPRQGGRGAPTKTTATTKQEAITRTFRLFGDEGATPPMQIKETVSFDLDKKLWDSGIGLSAWLVRLFAAGAGAGAGAAAADESQPGPAVIVRELRERLVVREECRVIELGAGTGIVSLVLAALRSANPASASHETRILSTDLPSSMELMSYNIRANAALYPHCLPTALPLDWDEGLPDAVRDVHERGGFDLIAMADVTYNTSSFPALLRTLGSLLASSDPHDHDHHAELGARAGPVAPEPLVLLAYKERDPAERQLWDMMARETGVVLECVGKLAGAGGLPVEIWLGKKGPRPG
ncbi:putative methyltransferase-domain-containing protein [Lactifluus subvellereus]|nr:putative methyltransferase-domain-containing protein [Lactifluus subvellereus]